MPALATPAGASTGWRQVDGRVIAALAAVAVVGGAAAGVAAVVERPLALPLLALTGAAIMLLVGLVDWRLPLLGLLLYLPVSGIPVIALYPHTAAPVLAKDFLFVIPAYVGFLLWAYRTRTSVLVPGAPLLLFSLLGLLVLGQALNPALPNTLVGAIGIKVWLFYIPLYFLAYHVVRSRSELFRLLALLSLVALVPAVIGIAEAVLFRGSSTSWMTFLNRVYGDAARATTQGYTQFELPNGGNIRRIPSTFSNWTQYYGFVLTMVAVSYAWWRGKLAGTRLAAIGLAVWLVITAATLLSGARAAFLTVPVLLILTFALERSAARVLPLRILAPVGALVVAVAALGASGTDVVRETLDKARLELTGTFADRFDQAVRITWEGLGTGIDTVASRYAYGEQSRFAPFGGVWFESWYVKVVLELGIVGLALVALLFATLVVRGLRSHARLRDPRLKVVSAALLAFLLVNIGAATTKPYLDLDPINVLFWLFAGLLARLPSLDEPADVRNP